MGIRRGDVVLADVGEPAVIRDAVDGQAGGDGGNLGAFMQEEGDLVGGYQDAGAGIQGESARAHAVRFCVLQQRGLAALRIYRVDGDSVFAAGEHLLALEIDGVAGAVGLIHDASVGMDVDRAGGLAGVDVGGVGQAVLGEECDGVERPVRQLAIDLQLALAFQRNENPGLRGVEIQVARLKVEAAVGAMDRRLVSTPS